jgi:hypothetical protein
VARDSKYGAVTVEHTPGAPLRDDEPVFLLRGIDHVAPGLIREYARRCELSGCTPAHVNAVYRAADDMEHWQHAHPRLVHRPD